MPTDDRSNDRADLIAQLVAEAHPVRRLWSPGRRLTIWLGVASLSLGLVLLLGPRPDIAVRLREPLFLLELATLAAAGVLLAGQALRHAVPGMESERVAGVLGLGALGGALLLREPIQGALSMEAFVALGAPCAGTALGLAAGPWAALVIALRRGAPLSAARAGALAGGAAAVLAFLLLRLRCPVDEVLHVVAWHALPVVVAGVACTAVGSWWFRRWRKRPV
jgi:hypothetical protein